MALGFDLVGFGQRLVSVLPASWFPGTSLTAGATPISLTEVPVADLMQGYGFGFAANYTELTYTQLQTRLATATDTNLDQASIDFFGGVLPRVFGESDTSFRARIMQLVICPQPTIPGLQAVLSAYMTALLAAPRSFVSLGDDTSGAMDTGQGAMDVTTPATGAGSLVKPFSFDNAGAMDNGQGFFDESATGGSAPYVYVFDQQSDPVTSALLGVVPPNFCVAILFPGVGVNLIRIASTAYSALFQPLVRYMKGEGFQDTYATNGP